jgi:Flp pilus assembly pilin Flp
LDIGLSVFENCEKLMISYLYSKSKTFLVEQEAVTSVEYAILLAVIAVFSISAILATGDVQQALWFDTADSLDVITP